ncbi:tetratricopeptide repeat protein [Roseateles sp. BYS180W]|uniref:Tetratricopeptide repeat protein n=1 Tax=Roseateles rivi TaxID=3299028 RepID=A0ABW7FZN4_9BURK
MTRLAILAALLLSALLSASNSTATSILERLHLSHPTPPFTAGSDLALLSQPKPLPRNINLNAFNPRREPGAFSCRQAALRPLPANPALQALHEEGLALTSPALWPNQRNWPRALQLWRQAADQGHWKAALMWLQTSYTGAGVQGPNGDFRVPPAPQETVVAYAEQLMRQGVADAFFWMGQFHKQGYGVKFSTDRAWAFWELAADLGSAKAQTKLASVLLIGNRELEAQFPGEWANRPLHYALLRCAHAQGYGAAGIQLGRSLDLDAQGGDLIAPYPDLPTQFRAALQILHDATKNGNEEAANYLFSSFSAGEPLVAAHIDAARAERYNRLGDALFTNPDLRFPNLDRVLPLPPAKLPPWDGKPESLINAAKALRPAPQPPAQPASAAPGRARIPAGHVLVLPPQYQAYAARALPGYGSVLALGSEAMGIQRAAVSGYYQASPRFADSPLRHHIARLPPLYFDADEPLRVSSVLTTVQADAEHDEVQWHYLGQARPAYVPPDHLSRAGLAHSLAQPATRTCAPSAVCPQSGVWQPQWRDPAHAASDHPLAALLDARFTGQAWRAQTFVAGGDPLPDPLAPWVEAGLDVSDAPERCWRLLWACERGFELSFAASPSQA